VTACLLASPAARAEQVTAACSGSVTDKDTASCSATFELSDPRFISILGTHAGYESPGGYGVMRLDWTDARGNLIAEFHCPSVGAVPAHVLRLGCWRAGPLADHYYPGTQTFTVTVQNATCAVNPCEFGGALALSAEGDLI